MRATCTGLAASWCPVHGDCTCPRNDDDGSPVERSVPCVVSVHGFAADSFRNEVVHDATCALHSLESSHAE